MSNEEAVKAEVSVTNDPREAMQFDHTAGAIPIALGVEEQDWDAFVDRHKDKIGQGLQPSQHLELIIKDKQLSFASMVMAIFIAGENMAKARLRRELKKKIGKI